MAILTALAAAALFGAATPVAKALLGSMSAFMVAGLFYLGSGLGLGVAIVARRLLAPTTEQRGQKISKAEMPWLLLVPAVSGIIALATARLSVLAALRQIY